MILKVSLSLCLLTWITQSQVTASNVRFPNEEENEKSAAAEERYSDSQSSSVVLQPNGVKRLPHFILPQVPSGQSPFGLVNPGGYAEGIILGQPSGRPPPNRHYKPNTKMPEKMKQQVQRVPYRVMAKPHVGQHQTRKPLFAPKGPPPPMDTRINSDANKHKNKYAHLTKEQEYHRLPKPEIVGLSEKELNKLKGNKYYFKGPLSHTENPSPYTFIPTIPPHDSHQNYDKNIHKEKIHKEKFAYTNIPNYGAYNPHDEYQNYEEHDNYKEDMKNSYHKHFVPVQEHVEEATYSPKNEAYTNFNQQNQHYIESQKNVQHPTVDALADYFNKWPGGNNYDNSKFNSYKDWSELEEPAFEKAWLSGSEWVPIHAPAPANLQEYTNLDNTFAANSNFNTYPSPAPAYQNNPSFSNLNGYNTQSFPTQSFTNSLTPQASTNLNNYARPLTEQAMNAFDLRAQIFQKPEVVIGKRPKSADVNNSHEVSAVFMVKQ